MISPLLSSDGGRPRVRWLLPIAVAVAVFLPRASAAPFPYADDFIDQYCAGCHGDNDPEARLDLTSLKYDPEDRANFAQWVKIFDRVKAGEMPPKKKTPPEPTAVEKFVQEMAATLTAGQKAVTARDGRAAQRRLNRYEYENALRDLLNAPWIQVRDKLPLDGERYGFNKSAEALDVSFVQMERYLSASDYALRQAMAAAYARPARTVRRIYARDQFGQFGYWPRENGTLPDRLAFPVLDAHAQPEVRAGRAPNSSPETREREAVGKVSSIFSDAGGYGWGFAAPTSGRYRLRLKGYTVWVAGGGIGRWMFDGQGAEKAGTYWLPVWHRPNADEIWPGRSDEPIGFYASSAGQTRPVGAIDFKAEPTVGEVEVMLAAGETVRTDAMRFFRTRVNGTDEQYVNPLATVSGMPGYAVQWLEVDGPLEDPAATSGYQLLFGDLPMRKLDAGQRGGVPLEGVGLGMGGGGRGGPGGRGGRGRGGPPNVMVEVVTENPEADAPRLLRGFIAAAYRRAATERDVQRFLALFQREYSSGTGFARAMLTAYTGVLSSPAFVFLAEKPGRLDDMALATRLSLFLWDSTPDAALRRRALEGTLHAPDVLRAETERLLDDPRSARFVEAFTDYWLDLRKIDDTSPSSTIYNDYDMDDPLKLAAVDETHLFFAELVRRDLPARNIVDSDFTFLNGRLARHYGIPGVEGAAMRRVTLPPGSDRGGLMTMAAVLKVTANGTTTSPVIRGHWITEHVLGVSIPPPPPGTKAVEPDIRGATTIRQQLEKHRADPSCASCHSKMDPPGFALENYDVMGGRRERYRAVSTDQPPVPGSGLNGQLFAFHWGLPVDAAGELPDGRAYRDVREFKALIVGDELPVARNLAKQLITFATGAPVDFADRAELEQMLRHASASHYGARSLIHTVIQSEMFQNK